MSEIEGKQPKCQKKTKPKPKTRQDVVTNAIPHVVEALTTIVLHSKCDDFKKKCCKMFKVDDPHLIKTCLEARLWNIAEKKLGITQPKDFEEQKQEQKELHKEDFDDLEFISHSDLVNFSKEGRIRDQLTHDSIKNVCCATPEVLPPMNNENRSSHSLSKTSCIFSAGSEYDDLHWDVQDSILECFVSETFQDHISNDEDHRMSDFSVPSPGNSYETQESLEFNKFDKTNEAQTSSLQLTCNTQLGFNPACSQTVQKEVKLLDQPHNSWTAPKAISLDGDWLSNYEHDNFWMDHSCIETNQQIDNKNNREETSCQHWKILDSSNLIQMSNPVCDVHTVTKELRKDAICYFNSIKGNDEFLEPRNIKDNYNLKESTPVSVEDTKKTCMHAGQQIGKNEGKILDVQKFYDVKQNEDSNDCNFDELAHVF